MSDSKIDMRSDSLNSVVQEVASTFSDAVPRTQQAGFIARIGTDFMSIGLYIVAISVMVYIVYTRLTKGNWLLTHLLFLGASLIVAYQLSTYSKGQKWDKWVTFFIWLLVFFVGYSSWFYTVYVADIPWNNPIVLLFFGAQFFLFGILLVSRYAKLNIVKVISWALGLLTIFVMFFTFSMWGTLKVCQDSLEQPGLKDPLYITLGIYIGWAIVVGCLFFVSEMTRGSEMWYALLIIGVGLSIWLTGYAARRCSETEKKIEKETGIIIKDTAFGQIEDESHKIDSGPQEEKAEQIARTEEVTWISTSIHILIIISYISFFIGQIFPAAWYAFLSFYILDSCKAPGDPRRLAAGSMLIILFPIGLLLKGASKTMFGQ